MYSSPNEGAEHLAAGRRPLDGGSRSLSVSFPGPGLTNHVRFSLFDGNGEWHGHQYSDHPRVIAACTTAFQAVWERATPHEDYQV